MTCACASTNAAPVRVVADREVVSIRVPASSFATGEALADARSLGLPSGDGWRLDAVSCTAAPSWLEVRPDGKGAIPLGGTLTQHADGLSAPLPCRWSGVLHLSIDPGDTPSDVFLAFTRRRRKE